MAELIQDTVDRLTAFIEQNYTDIEIGPGSVINELLIKLAATIQNDQRNYMLSLSQGNTFKAVIESNEPTYLPSMDLWASNYNTSRSEGSKVSGKIKVYTSEPTGYSLAAGFVFIQPALNLQYVLKDDIRVSITPYAPLNEIQLIEEQGFYYFILDVEAVEVGPAYQVSSGTAFTIGPREFLNYFVKAEAYGNFSTGKAPETDKELVLKIKNNLGNSRFESSAGIAKRFSEMFPGFQSLSVCGANDPEMTRSKQNILGISTFGKADVYVRSSLGPETKLLRKEAKKVAEGTWEIHILNTDVPGFYNIKSILPDLPNILIGGTLGFNPPVFDMQFFGNQRNNELLKKEDARFTKYQTAKITFKYNDTSNLPVNSYAEFIVQVGYQPNILEMQDLLLLDDTRLASADYLVKAVVPCMVSLKINLLKKRPTDTYESLNLAKLKQDIFTYINSIPFGGDLQASSIVDLCHNYNIKRVDLPIDMRGIILCPDGSSIAIEDNDVLTIPHILEKGVTPKTTAYFIDYYRIEKGVLSPIDNIGLNIA
jgi:hypothetical protein